MKFNEESKENQEKSRIVKNDKNEQLMWELECLIRHRDKKEEKTRSRFLQKDNSCVELTDSTPIFMQVKIS